METIHTRIKQRREGLGFSMETLAALCGPVTWQTVQQWENGKTAPKRRRLALVATALAVTEEWLLYGGSSKKAPGGTLFESQSGAHRDHPLVQQVCSLAEQVSDDGLKEIIGYIKCMVTSHPRVRPKPFSKPKAA